MDARVGLKHRDESAATNVTLEILTDSVGRFEQRVSELVAQFAGRFAFIDYARSLEFSDKPRLTEFFEKSRGLFPDTMPQLLSPFQQSHPSRTEESSDGRTTKTKGYFDRSIWLQVCHRGSSRAVNVLKFATDRNPNS